MIDQIKNYLLIALAIGVAVAYFFGISQGKDIGKAQAKIANDRTIAKMELELKAARKQSQEVILKLETKLESNRRKSDEKIRTLLRQNKDLQHWWNTKVPDDAVDFIYSDADGLPDGS
jgi:uncharacterized protein HemX